MDPIEDTHHVTTPDELKALAHPLRLRLLGLLRTDGPDTASGLGARLGESSGVTSYHLRYLAERNFVEEAPELGNKRERWWRSVKKSTEWNPADFLDSREGRAADLAFRRENLRFTRAAVDNWLVEEDTWPREWVGAAVSSDMLFHLTVDQLREFGEDFRELTLKYIGLSEANDHAADDVERVYSVLHTFPVRDLNP